MNSICQSTFIILVVLLVAADSLRAQPLPYSMESIESLVINADRVWVARIIGVRDKPIPGGSKMPGITIAIEETLKTPLFEQRYKKMGLFVKPPTTAFKEFQKRSSRLLIAQRDHEKYSPTVIELIPGKTKVFRADFTLLQDPKTVTKVAREIISRTPANIRQVHTFRITVPEKIRLEAKLRPHLSLIVPVDEGLEKLAIKFLESKLYIQRLEAARALRYFKSMANIVRLRPLIEDSGTSDYGDRKRYYGVRDEAFKTLSAWGIEIERPVVFETDQPPE